MSIEMENPKTVIEKIDAAANYVAQAEIAVLANDRSHLMRALEEAGKLLHEAAIQAGREAQ
jgi:hypothetical protein